jgi:SulP family sulfate permease
LYCYIESRLNGLLFCSVIAVRRLCYDNLNMAWRNKLLNVLAKDDQYSSLDLKADVIAGITVALILVPQSIAYAQLAELPAQYGLYAALIPPVLAAIFGSSRHLATGPVAVISLLTATAVATLGYTGGEAFGVVLLIAFMLGLFQVALGLLRLGVLVHLLSHPVIYGFTNAAAIVIGFSQLPKVFGVKLVNNEHFFPSIISFFDTLSQGFNYSTFLIGMVALGLLIVVRRINNKLPAVLITIILTTLFSWWIHFERLGAIIGEIPIGLPMLTIPSLPFSKMTALLPSVLTIAVVGFTETISVAQALAAKTKQRIDPNRELIGQGLANLGAAFSQGYPVAGSLSRSAVNIRAGARSSVAMVVASLIVLLTLLVLTPLLYNIPQAVLAVVIIFSVSSLIDFKHVVQVWRTNRADAVAAALTFFTTLIFAPHLDNGILLGLSFSIAYYFYRNMHPRIVTLSRYKDGVFHDTKSFHLEECENIAVIRFDAPLFFANADFLVEEVLTKIAEKKHLKYILLIGDGITQIDSTGEEKLSEIIDLLRGTKRDIYFTNLRLPILQIFQRTGLDKKIKPDHIFTSAKEGVQYLISRTKHHTDQAHCPLIKYVHLAEEQLEHHSRAENAMLFFRRIFLSQPNV